MDKLKILSYNVKGFRCKHKRGKVLTWLNNIEFDILNIRESHYMNNDLEEWTKDWKGEIIASEGERNKKGVCILIRKDLEH